MSIEDIKNKIETFYITEHYLIPDAPRILDAINPFLIKEVGRNE